MTQLNYAEKRMQQKWYELVMAEQQGAAVPVLERMYSAYVLAMEEYNRCTEQQEPQAPVTLQPNHRRKKAS